MPRTSSFRSASVLRAGMRSVACLAVFGVLLLSAVSAFEDITSEQALDILDTLQSSPVRHSTGHGSLRAASPPCDRSCYAGTPNSRAHLPPSQ